MHVDHQPSKPTMPAPRLAIGENVARTMSSREMSELTGKRHDSVKRTIETLAFKTDKNGDPAPVIGVPQIVEYLDTLGRPANEYHVSKRDSFVVVAQLCPEFTAKLVDRWQELETQAAKPAIFIPQTLPDALRLAADLADQKAKAEAERDHAVATKAQIGSRREATAMAAASAAKREAARLAQELGRGTHHATIIAVEKASGLSFGNQGFRPLKAWCQKHGVTAAKVPCPRYGQAVSWPAAAWSEVYGVELGALFGAWVDA